MDRSDYPADQHIVHEYDGILEADNRLPRWWLYTLYGTIAFAAVYWLYYETYRTGASPKQVYDGEQMARAKIEAERLAAAGPITPEKLIEMSQNAAIVESGKAVFTTNCVSCHLATGGGQVGPNLTDPYWIHGGKPEQILASVRAGYLDKGMPPWGQVLGEAKVREVTAYALTLKNTNVAGGKAPQGDKEE
jgi:cytochrome c oxidase cbb3-type subunit 3